MKLWLIFVQADDHTWLEAAWDDESTAENHSGWEAEVDRVDAMCRQEPGYEMRVAEVNVRGVYELFDVPRLQPAEAKAVE